MTSLDGNNGEKSRQSSAKATAPKVEVQRSISRETITIRFSAIGKEEEEEEETLSEDLDDQNIITAVEAKEDLYFDTPIDLTAGPATSSSMAVTETSMPTSSSATTPIGYTVNAAEASSSTVSSDLPPSLSTSTSQQSLDAVPANTSSSLEQKPVKVSSPSKAVTLSSSPSISGSKPFFSLVKSLSTELEPKESTMSIRHRHLMKTLVKSLSTDTSKQDPDSASHRPPDSKINLHLFKQFTQPRVTGGDSKTAPSSPLTSPSDGRSFFKVPEMEARIEDTKRRFSEVIYEPFQLLSKMMGEESSSYRPKALSSSASELSNLSSLNGHMENNNNYSIKEEEGDTEADNSTCESSQLKDEKIRNRAEDSKELGATLINKDTPFKSTTLALEKCSLSVLASKEDEEFTELYSEDFDFEENEEYQDVEDSEEQVRIGSLSEEEELDVHVERCDIPVQVLYFLVALVYGYFILPLPSYVSGLCLGVAFGFMAAIGMIWLFASPRSCRLNQSLYLRQSAVDPLNISEPEILKGWMNEIQNYDPETYHATLTYSVFVRLEGSTLRLSKPSKNISRRASYNESKPEEVFVSQKIYDLVDCKVSLVPRSLARKRLWNKKYPICLELAHQEDFMSKAQVDKDSIEEKGDSSSQDGGKALGNREQVLYLFGRTGREKEQWFQSFLGASKLKAESKKSCGTSAIKAGLLLTHSRSSSKGSMDEVMSQPRSKECPGSIKQKMLLDYNVYMAQSIPQDERSPDESPVQSTNSSPTAAKKVSGAAMVAEDPQAWVNALLGRMFWDFLGEKYWSDLVSKKIQMKLSKIKLPYFMNELTLTELDMGVSVPKILQAYKPTIDHRGLWTDLEISYNGSFLMTLETKMNLTKLGKEPFGEALKVTDIGKEGARPRAYYLADSDEESSSAGSSDEEDAPELSGDKQQPGAEGYVGPHRTSKIMRFVDKITKSKYFQKATETEFIKKKMEEVSNTPLLLTVEVQECRGTLAINIPPPPTDRIWYGFRKPPHLELKARPKLGERLVTLGHVTEWIEKKLEQEFQKIFVMPNMDDVYVTVMHSATDSRSSTDLDAVVTPVDAP
ncbi:PREDICTED: testis-expressed sequence 2 protein [Nanorana parkeri]|uniref:testis-expressed sequence 2 protein n=1 Tax=Nanorana parkeri TaxID=125878 RepID=UPI000854EB73|nr:PREDICTED: testis-expressed sequence 2 protein [Nanorana parkeri]